LNFQEIDGHTRKPGNQMSAPGNPSPRVEGAEEHRMSRLIGEYGIEEIPGGTRELLETRGVRVDARGWPTPPTSLTPPSRVGPPPFLCRSTYYTTRDFYSRVDEPPAHTRIRTYARARARAYRDTRLRPKAPPPLPSPPSVHSYRLYTFEKIASIPR